MSDCQSTLHKSSSECLPSLRSAVRPLKTPEGCCTLITWSPERACLYQNSRVLLPADFCRSVQPQHGGADLPLLFSTCLPTEPHSALLFPTFLLHAQGMQGYLWPCHWDPVVSKAPAQLPRTCFPNTSLHMPSLLFTGPGCGQAVFALRALHHSPTDTMSSPKKDDMCPLWREMPAPSPAQPPRALDSLCCSILEVRAQRTWLCTVETSSEHD